jgi:hypothetical protein
MLTLGFSLGIKIQNHNRALAQRLYIIQHTYFSPTVNTAKGLKPTYSIFHQHPQPIGRGELKIG